MHLELNQSRCGQWEDGTASNKSVVHTSGEKPQIEVSGCWLYSEPPLVAYRGPRPLRVLTPSSLYVCVCPDALFLREHQSHGCWPTHMTSVYLNHPSKGSVSKHSHSLKHWGLGLQHMDFGGDTGESCNSDHMVKIKPRVLTCHGSYTWLFTSVQPLCI